MNDANVVNKRFKYPYLSESEKLYCIFLHSN